MVVPQFPFGPLTAALRLVPVVTPRTNERPRLFEYAADGKAEELRQLLAWGTIGSVKVLDSKGRTALNIAVTEEHLDVVQARGGVLPAGREGRHEGR